MEIIIIMKIIKNNIIKDVKLKCNIFTQIYEKDVQNHNEKTKNNAIKKEVKSKYIYFKYIY